MVHGSLREFHGNTINFRKIKSLVILLYANLSHLDSTSVGQNSAHMH